MGGQYPTGIYPLPSLLVLRRLRATGCYVGSLRAPFGDGAVQGKQGRAAAARDLACGLVWATGQIKGASKGHKRRELSGLMFCTGT